MFISSTDRKLFAQAIWLSARICALPFYEIEILAIHQGRDCQVACPEVAIPAAGTISAGAWFG